MSWDLVADIGGTNMRVAQVQDGQILSRKDFAMVPGRDVANTLAGVAREIGRAPGIVVAAGAGPVKNGAIELTNGGWLVCEREIAAATGAAHVRVINDFEAAAWSLANPDALDIQPLGASGSIEPGHRVAVGPGTGLGVGVLTWDGTGYAVIAGEGGHVATGPQDSSEIEIFERLCALWPEVQIGAGFTVEAEAFLSGTGLPKLYEACGGIGQTPGREIFERAQGAEKEAEKAVSVFRNHLAALAGNMAVSVNARGGVFLLGGVAQSNPWIFDDAFWAHFSAGGRAPFTALRERCGVYLVTARDFGLQGCINALRRKR